MWKHLQTSSYNFLTQYSIKNWVSVYVVNIFMHRIGKAGLMNWRYIIYEKNLALFVLVYMFIYN